MATKLVNSMANAIRALANARCRSTDAATTPGPVSVAGRWTKQPNATAVVSECVFEITLIG